MDEASKLTNEKYGSNIKKHTEEHLKELVSKYLDEKIKLPVLSTITRDPIASLRWSNSFVLLRLSERLIVDHDVKVEKNKDRQHTEEAHKDVEKKSLYLGYLGKELESSLVLLGSTDYIGSLILMRSILEFLIGLATDMTGSMKKRIWAIDFLSESERKTIHKLWNELNAWTHPYGRWRKELCPKFYGCGNNFHPPLFEECLNHLDTIVDLMLTITVEQFKLDTALYMSQYKHIQKQLALFEISNLKMLESRLMGATMGIGLKESKRGAKPLSK